MYKIKNQKAKNSDVVRLFIAIAIPLDILSFISEVYEKFKSNGLKLKFIPKENIHITLKFIGNANKNLIEPINYAMRNAVTGINNFDVNIEDIGVFPNIKSPRILWLGLNDKSNGLKKLFRKIKNNLYELGVPKDKRDFKKHLTISRIKTKIDSDNLISTINMLKDFTSESFKIEQVNLYKSDLKPFGAIYTMLKTVALNYT